jgi:hypothetical protein
VRAKLLTKGIDLDDSERCAKQLELAWFGTRGVLCAGKLDIHWFQDRASLCVDLKATETANPAFLERQIFEQGWHVQAAAYEEARRKCFTGRTIGPHFLCIVDEKHDIVSVVPMGESYIECVRRDWEAAQRIWVNCWSTGNWPEYSEAPIEAPRYVRERCFGR